MPIHDGGSDTEVSIRPDSALATTEVAPAFRKGNNPQEEGQQDRRIESAPRRARFAAGAVLGGRYRVVGALGQGGMGEVYRADDLELGGSVALKFLPEAVEQNERRLNMLLFEARAARTVSHPNVCRVHDIGVHRTEAGELHFISMEFVDGEDLSSLLRRTGRLPKGKALNLSLELCHGLAAVHKRGLLHCDIKPSNVMIDGNGHVRLTDFGLAVFGSESGTHGGTPAYMAPEQHAGRVTTARSDIYALGLVLYEIFTGERAFRADSSAEYAWLHLQARPTPPSDLVPDLDDEIEKVICACLETAPERRVPSADAVAAALAQLDSGTPNPPGLVIAQGEALRTVLLCDLVDSTGLTASLGNRRAAELGQRHDRLARDLLARHKGREIDKSDGFLLLFELPVQALQFALEYHEALDHLSSEEGVKLSSRVGIHFGEIWLRENPHDDVARGAKSIEVEGLAKAVAARLMSVAEGGQTLLSRGAFDLSRRAEGFDDAEELRWLDHGSWRLHGVADPIDVFEVGREGYAPLRPPVESEKVRKLLMQPRIGGWRPAADLVIPKRPNWQIERRLGEGGLGEVWLARHVKTGERRGFKFCFDAERLKALQREITLFRLLKVELGDRDDINRILDWNLDEAPYFIESEYTSGGSLADWGEIEGGLDNIPLADRLEIVAQVATALAAAHSVGILHKDVKPSNVLIQPLSGGVQAQLADFGIGQVTERERLVAAGITVLGLSEHTFEETSSPDAGTRLYMAPELLEGQAPTLQADLYALGVMLYQVVVGDVGRALAPGWRRDVNDEILAEDIACFVDRSPDRRPSSAREVADRLRTLDKRREEMRIAVEARQALEISRRRRRVYQVVAATSLLALIVVSVLAIWAVDVSRKERQAREATERVLDFVVNLFEIADPSDVAIPDERRSETITAKEILDRGAERVDHEFSDQPVVRARLMATFGEIYCSLGFYDQAEPLLTESLEIRRRWLDESPQVAQGLYLLGRLLLAVGDIEQAGTLQQEAVEMQERLLGPEHPDTLRTMTDLAITFFSMGNLDQARTLHEQTFEIQGRVLGPEHPDTLNAMIHLGTIFSLLGDYKHAKILREQTLEIQRRVLGPEHPGTLATMVRLANSFSTYGDFKQSKVLNEQALEIQQRVLGPEHLSTVHTMVRLADNLCSLGDFEQARPLSERTLGTLHSLLGSEHPSILWAKTTLSRCFYFMGDLEQARRLGEQSMEIQQRIFEAEHPATLWTMGNLSYSVRALGDLEEAKMLQEDALEALERQLPARHPIHLETMNNLARTLWRMGEFGRAQELARAAFDGFEAQFGAKHFYTTRAAQTLLEIAVGQNDRQAISLWTEELRWLVERNAVDIEFIDQRRTRQYVLGLSAAAQSGDE